MARTVTVQIDPELVAAIDAVAGARGRSRWIVAACRERLERKTPVRPGERAQTVPSPPVARTPDPPPGPSALVAPKCPHSWKAVPNGSSGLRFEECTGCGDRRLRR